MYICAVHVACIAYTFYICVHCVSTICKLSESIGQPADTIDNPTDVIHSPRVSETIGNYRQLVALRITRPLIAMSTSTGKGIEAHCNNPHTQVRGLCLCFCVCLSASACGGVREVGSPCFTGCRFLVGFDRPIQKETGVHCPRFRPPDRNVNVDHIVNSRQIIGMYLPTL